MRLWARTCLGIAALLVTALLLAAAIPWSLPERSTDADIREGGYFHAGKTLPEREPDPSCQSIDCHVGYPHERDGILSAFRNMHVRFVDCLSCHGLKSQDRWTLTTPMTGGSPGSFDTRVRIQYTIPPEGKMMDGHHALLVSPVRCRGCHSDSRRTALSSRGVADLPAGFANPVSLRMIEEGAKNWIPPDLR